MQKSGFWPACATVVTIMASLAPISVNAESQFLERSTRDYFAEIVDEGNGQMTAVYYSALAKKLRRESQNSQSVWIVDYNRMKILVIKPGSPPEYWEGPHTENQDKFIQTGASRRVAGHTCFVWKRDPSEPPHNPSFYTDETCRTSDGVPLRGVVVQNGQRTVHSVVTLSLEPQDPALFRVPPGAVKK